MGTRLGEQEYLLSGEFHYFRIPRDSWRKCLDRFTEAGLDKVSIYVPWNWHNFDEDALDFQGSSTPERDLLGALELIAELGLKCIFRPGPFITAEWKNGGIPQWLIDSKPQVLALGSGGEPCVSGAYPAFTYAHVDFRAACSKWIHNVLDVTHSYLEANGGPIANLQLDDEPSYFQKLIDPLALDYNPVLVSNKNEDGLTKYQAWLMTKYGSLAALIDCYQMKIKDVCDIQPPQVGMLDKSELPRFLDWLFFKLDQVNNYVEFLYDIFVKKAPDCPISMLYPYLQPQLAGVFSEFATNKGLNIQLTNECYLSLNAPSICSEAKIGHIMACHEVYNMWRKDDQGPAVSMELQASNATNLSPGAMEILYALTISRGIRGMNYFMMAGGYNPQGYENDTGSNYDISAPIGASGEIRPHYRVISKVSKVVRALWPIINTSEVVYDTWLGCYRNYEAASMGGAAFAYDAWGHQISFNLGDMGLSEANSLPVLLACSSVSFGCIDISKDALQIDPTVVNQLWVGALEFMSRSSQANLLDYVNAGGHLILEPVVPTLDEKGRECRVLFDAIHGLDSGSTLLDGGKLVTDGPVQFAGYSGPWDQISLIYSEDNECLVVPGLLSKLEVPGQGRILARSSNTGDPCAYEVPIGKGSITLLGFRLAYSPGSGNDQEQFVRKLVGRTLDRKLMEVESSPLSAFKIEASQGGLVCLINPTETPLCGRVKFQSKLLDQGQVEIPKVIESIRMPGKGAILIPYEMSISKRVYLKYSTFEVIGIEQGHTTVILKLAVRDFLHDSSFEVQNTGELALSGLDSLVRIEGGLVLSSERSDGVLTLVIQSLRFSPEIVLEFKCPELGQD